MARCAYIKPNGELCKGDATGPHGLCWSHDPANAEKRSRNASRAAKSKPNHEIADIKSHLKELTLEVLSGAVATAPYAVANQLINTRLRAVELERKVKETEQLEERIERLEQQAQNQQGGRKWGA